MNREETRRLADEALERRAGVAALAVPAILGFLAAASFVFDLELFFPFVVLGFPPALLVADDGSAAALLLAALAWAPVALAPWWWAGRWAARSAATTAGVFSWAAWLRTLTAPGLLILVSQFAVVFTIALLLSAI